MTHVHTLPHTTNLTERILRVRFCLPLYPFLRSFSLQITTGTTKTVTTRTDIVLPDTMTGETATAVIETETGNATRDAIGIEDTTGIVIDGTTTGGPEDTREEEEGDTDENARKDLVEGAMTKCKLTALQRVTAATAREGGVLSVVGTVWALPNEGVLPRQMRPRFL